MTTEEQAKTSEEILDSICKMDNVTMTDIYIMMLSIMEYAWLHEDADDREDVRGRVIRTIRKWGKD